MLSDSNYWWNNWGGRGKRRVSNNIFVSAILQKQVAIPYKIAEYLAIISNELSCYHDATMHRHPNYASYN